MGFFAAGHNLWRKSQWFFEAFLEMKNNAVEFFVLIFFIFCNKMSRIEFLFHVAVYKTVIETS